MYIYGITCNGRGLWSRFETAKAKACSRAALSACCAGARRGRGARVGGSAGHSGEARESDTHVPRCARRSGSARAARRDGDARDTVRSLCFAAPHRTTDTVHSLAVAANSTLTALRRSDYEYATGGTQTHSLTRIGHRRTHSSSELSSDRNATSTRCGRAM